ncbi:MAG: hypothetical protein ACRDP8_14290 [Actinopolymorphaceae bacterium]
MRDNGLRAASYLAIADLDPRVADRMLDLLAAARVAAYTEPCPPVLGPCLEIRLPAIPCDRLFVDETAEERARAVLADHLHRPATAGSEDAEPAQGADATDASPGSPSGPGGQTTLDEEQAWAAIIAGYDTTAPDVVPRWPVQEDDTSEEAGAESASDGSAKAGAGGAAEQHPAETSSVPPSSTDPEGYVPPPPAPLPRVEPLTKFAWAAFLGGPVLLLLASVAGSYVPSWFVVVGVVCFIAGFLTLVVRMKGGPPDDEDGAIV